METNLRVRGEYIRGEKGGQQYKVELVDGDIVVDAFVFFVEEGKVQTPASYPRTPEGARQYGKDHWL